MIGRSALDHPDIGCRDFTENDSWDPLHRYNATQAAFLQQRQTRVPPPYGYFECLNPDTPPVDLDEGFICAETLSQDDKSSTLGAISIVLIIIGSGLFILAVVYCHKRYRRREKIPQRSSSLMAAPI